MSDFLPETFAEPKKSWTNFSKLCKGCGLCIEKCPQKCLKFDKKRNNFYGTPAVECDIAKCISCGICEIHCPDQAIKVEKK